MTSKEINSQKTISDRTKQSILLANLTRHIKDEQYLTKMYNSQIEILEKQKQQLSNRLENWSKEGSSNKKIRTQSCFENNVVINQSKIVCKTQKSDQVLQPLLTPTKLHDFLKKKTDSPIRNLHYSTNGSLLKINKMITNNNNSFSTEPKYSKTSQLQKQIKDLTQKLIQKQSKYQKYKPDEISDNLMKKITQQQLIYQQELKKYQEYQLLKNVKNQLEGKMARIQEQMFKQNQGISAIKNQHINRNKNIVKDGYTKKMVEVIAAYGGVRK